MKRTLLMLACLAVTGAAFAQSYSPVDVSVRAGVVFPFEDKTRDTAKSLIGFGLDYTFPTQFIRGSNTFASLDYTFKNLNDSKGKMISLMVNQRAYLGMESSQGLKSYGFIGAGASWISATRTRAVLGARGGLGVEFSPQIFTELTVMMTGSVDGVRGNGVGLYLGYKF